jgi:UDP-N-acetylmuramoyl-L-alanyl-D-glutamate--2,6-diaminopimelate ligase
MAMTLGQLCAPWPGLEVVAGPDTPVQAVVEDSRAVVPGAVFVAVSGHGHDGHQFLAQAVAARATAVIVDRHRLQEFRAALPDPSVAWATASRTRGLPSRLARECEGRPDERLVTVGVTGTNGKTTTAFLLQELLGELHGPCGLLGTIRYDDGREQVPAPLTTPGGPVLYAWLARMAAAGCRAAAMEISSHALDQERPGELALDVAVLTNLGRDHLDYHGDMAHYLAAKARIMDLLRAGPHRGKPEGVVALNVADEALAGLGTGGLRCLRFAAGRTPASVPVDLAVTDVQLSLTGTRIALDWRGRSLTLVSPLVGRFNVENLLAALASGLALGYAADACLAALTGIAQVPGRMERFLLPSGALAVVDYAHTHDALAAVLGTCRELCPGRLHVVFGCGGDRDRGKRPLMGEVAARLADNVIITSDNPRSEDPAAICREVALGFDSTRDRLALARRVVVDRTDAITAALAAADEGDVVVVAGKGHEDYQQVGGRTLHLDAREIIRSWLAKESTDE